MTLNQTQALGMLAYSHVVYVTSRFHGHAEELPVMIAKFGTTNPASNFVPRTTTSWEVPVFSGSAVDVTASTVVAFHSTVMN